MKSSRTKNSIRNSFASTMLYIITILMGFVSQAVFIRKLGAEYNGIRGLFSNILSMVSIAELGFGSAIVYHLYKPMAQQNKQEIRTLVKYYKNVYHIIAGIIFIIGMLLLPMIPTIVGEVSIPENIKLLFFLYLLSIVVSYLLTYKRSVLYADQKHYITNTVSGIFVILRSLVQIAIVIFTKNFVLYLINQIIFALLENVVINMIVNKNYDYIKNLSEANPLSKELKKDITVKVKGLLFHKIAGVIVLGTDNIIISMTKSLGIVTVGMYSNYNMIIGQVKNLFANMISSLTASIGNLLIEKDKAKARTIYQSILLVNSWIFCFCAISIYCMIQPFIKLWIGSEYLFDHFVLVVLLVNLYIQGMRQTTMAFKDAAGVFYEDRFVPLIEAVINLVSSLMLVQVFGLAGIFMGTIISNLFLYVYSYPKYVYKLVLEGTYREFFKLHILHAILTFIICLITAYFSSLITVSNQWLQLLLNGILCLTVPNILYLAFALKMPEFEFYKNKLSNILKIKGK